MIGVADWIVPRSICCLGLSIFGVTRRSGITNDPNRTDDPKYILRLIGQVISVSLETVKIVRSLSNLGI